MTARPEVLRALPPAVLAKVTPGLVARLTRKQVVEPVRVAAFNSYI